MNEPTTIVELTKKLRKLGVRGYSGKNKEELIEMYRQTIVPQNKPPRKSRSPQKKAKSSFDILFDDTTIDKFRRQSGINTDVLITKTMTLSSRDKKNEFVSKLDDDLCDGLGEYLLDALKRAHEKTILGDDPYSDIVIDYVYILNPEKKICSILVAHRGECAKIYDKTISEEITSKKPLWNWWTVRLICNRKSPDCKGNASKLLGVYCYCLKAKQIQTHGLLEVAGNYNNIGGYCLYSKYGFVETKFPCESFEWLQMGTDLRKLTYRQIMDTVMTGKKSIPETGSTLYCEELKAVSILNESRDPSDYIYPMDRNDPSFEPIVLESFTVSDINTEEDGRCNIM